MIWLQLCLGQMAEIPTVPERLKATSRFLRPTMLRFTNTIRHPLAHTFQARERMQRRRHKFNGCAKLRR